LIKQVRQEAPETLVLDAGDSLIGDRSPATTSRGASSVELLDAMGYDAMVLGEGDLDRLGIARVGELLPEAQFATLSANVAFTDKARLLGAGEGRLQPYLVRRVAGYDVAVIGLTGSLASDEAAMRDMIEGVREAVKQASQEADVLILLSHAGITVNLEIAGQFPELDLVISGGGKGYTPQPLVSEGAAPIVHADMASPGHAGRRAGVGTWWFDERGRLLGYQWESVSLAPEIADDPELSVWVTNHP
jgi:2',3'-cyclic-nucleotide 2'-phosphodiesterase (5'-nucleotidase family)